MCRAPSSACARGAGHRRADGQAGRPQPTGLGQRPGVAAIGLDPATAGRVHGREFGSATITSWPNPSRRRATHSLSVEASRRMRARGRSPSRVANRSGVMRSRGRSAHPLRPGSRAGFPACAVDANMGHGWPPLFIAALTAIHSVGQCMPPRRMGVSHFIRSCVQRRRTRSAGDSPGAACNVAGLAGEGPAGANCPVRRRSDTRLLAGATLSGASSGVKVPAARCECIEVGQSRGRATSGAVAEAN